jgi:hypothetical protein
VRKCKEKATKKKRERERERERSKFKAVRDTKRTQTSKQTKPSSEGKRTLSQPHPPFIYISE